MGGREQSPGGGEVTKPPEPFSHQRSRSLPTRGTTRARCRLLAGLGAQDGSGHRRNESDGDMAWWDPT